MLKQQLNRLNAVTGASFVMGTMLCSTAEAAPAKTFNDIADNILTGIGTLPGFLSAISYMMGMLFSVLGILKIKDHVENPTQTHLKDGAIRLAVGGGLFMIPIITESMQTLIGTGTKTDAAVVSKIATATTLAK
ncbi:MAG: hypothetical protein PHX61_04665 [Alphaproteobacteria bacterium]|nr:hypothetical protein [Alphaproteobacteria bacterium]OIN86184.1 MAG: hypothetical protein AUJ12_06840 [Alphaproteobacteria bacterium CG1_02_46_17]